MQKGKNKKKVVLAVAGFEDAQAATSLAIALASMANSSKWRKIVVLEMGNRYIYTKIRRFFNEDMVDIDGTFQVDGVTFVPGADQEMVVRMAAKEDIFLILDCGDRIEEFATARGLCGRRILLCNLLPWRIRNVCHFLEHGMVKDQWDCILVTDGKANRKRIRKKTGCRMKPWNHIEDPFRLSTDDVRELYHLACGEKYITM